MRKFQLFLVILGLCNYASYAQTGSQVSITPIVGAKLCNNSGGQFVNYTTTGTFNPGNVFTAQLSDSNGLFTNPTNIGSVAATAGGMIPVGIAPSFLGSGYRIRIISSSPSYVGPDNGSDFSIHPSIYISSNNPSQGGCAPVNIDLTLGLTSSDPGTTYEYFQNGVPVPTPKNVTYGGNFTIIGTSPHGCKAETGLTYFVFGRPEIRITQFNPVCEDAPPMVISANTQFGWYEHSGTGIIGGAGTNLVFSPTQAGPGTYKFKFTGYGGVKNTCTNVDSTIIVVKPKPKPTITESRVECPGAPVTLTASDADTYVWSTGATTKSIIVHQNGAYSVTVIKDGCSGSSQPFNVTLPTVDTEKPIIQCAGDQLLNTANNLCGATYLGVPTATDNCSSVQITGQRSDGKPLSESYPVGSTTIVWTAKDEWGNSSTCTQAIQVKDEQKPLISCPAVSTLCNKTDNIYTIPLLEASDNCGIQNITYTIMGSTTRSGTGLDASGNFLPGASTITWIVSDIHGNQATCVSNVQVSHPIGVTIPDALALQNGALPNTVYYGYGPASKLLLSATASGGNGNYQYQWSNGGSSSSITVQPTQSTLYTVTVTDASGCKNATSKWVEVVDVRCGNNMNKVMVCKDPPGNSGNRHTICVDANAVPSHLASGSSLGDCLQEGETSSRSIQPISEEKGPLGFSLSASPNPSNQSFDIVVKTDDKEGRIELVVFNAVGQEVERKVALPNQPLRLGSTYRAGMYVIQVTQGLKKGQIKIIKQ
jgi:hypothetical protein